MLGLMLMSDDGHVEIYAFNGLSVLDVDWHRLARKDHLPLRVRPGCVPCIGVVSVRRNWRRASAELKVTRWPGERVLLEPEASTVGQAHRNRRPYHRFSLSIHQTIDGAVDGPST